MVQWASTWSRGEGHGLVLADVDRFLAEDAPEARWLRAVEWAFAALAYAYEGRVDDALRALERVLPVIERAAGWALNYTVVIGSVILERRDHTDVLERNLRHKTLAPDFRFPHTDARLALAQLCALTGRFDEAREWFEKARHASMSGGRGRCAPSLTSAKHGWRCGAAGLETASARSHCSMLRAVPSSRSACRGGCAGRRS